MIDDARTQGEMKTSFEDQRLLIEDVLGSDSDALTSKSRNSLINGDFRVSQRGTSFSSTTTPINNDDTYLLDRWLLLSDGNDVVDVTKDVTVVPTGSSAAIRLDVETGDLKFGIVQILEFRDTSILEGGNVSLSFKARRTGTSIDHLRAAVLGWASTADVVTSDVVDTTNWGGAGTDPTLATNWNYENTPANLATLTTSYQTFKIENIGITAGRNNLAVFIWIDDVTVTVGDFLYITDVQLELGADSTPFERRPFSTELALSQRYFYIFSETSAQYPFGFGFSQATNDFRGFIPTPVEMRTTPTIASGPLKYRGNADEVDAVTIGGILVRSSGVRFQDTGITLTAADFAYVIQADGGGVAPTMDAEL